MYFWKMVVEYIEYGYVGLFFGAFLAATLFPLPSEGLLVGAIAIGIPPIPAVITATIGNFLGGMTNYGLGYLASHRKFLSIVKVRPSLLKRWETRFHNWGYWLGLLAWVPIIGDPMLLALGFLRVRILPLCVTVILGKLIRYIVVASLFVAT
jgi:membrane protein YqaA with SNARE-associated domain